MNAQNNNFPLKVIFFILIVAVLLFGGIGITGAAARSALPGDALYPVKTTIEQTRLSLAQDAGDRAQMKLVFAEQRLTEISGLIREGRYREISEAVLAFEASINEAILELETVSTSDPARAASIAQEITSALTRYSQTLSILAASAPDSVRDQVERALDTTNIVTGLGLPSANDNANDNSTANDNSNTNDNGNDNTNDNSNANANVNDNGNDNSNANVNDNSNDNGDDHGGNSNSSDDSMNSNSNANDNGDDNSNSNANTNSNDNGDDSGGGSNNNDDSSGRGGGDDTGYDDSSGRGGGGGDDSSGKGSGKDH